MKKCCVLHFVENIVSIIRCTGIHRSNHDVNDSILYSAMYFFLVYLDRGIYLPHERVSADVSDCSAHNTQGQAEQRHVTEIKRRLEETIHSTKKNKTVKQLQRL